MVEKTISLKQDNYVLNSKNKITQKKVDDPNHLLRKKSFSLHLGAIWLQNICAVDEVTGRTWAQGRTVQP